MKAKIRWHYLSVWSIVVNGALMFCLTYDVLLPQTFSATV